MTKSAGFLKKLKKLGPMLKKGIEWVNTNVVKPLNPVIDTALDFIPYGSTIKGVKNMASKAIDSMSDGDDYEDPRAQKYIKMGADFLLDTQRSDRDKKYKNPFGTPIN